MLYLNNPLYFVTCCTERRRHLLANAQIHPAFTEFGERAYCDFRIALGRYVIMPDHLHFFVAGPDDFILGRWVGTLKRFLAKHVKTSEQSDPIWQRGFFDHVIRSGESYSQKWDYVCENPVRAGLAKHSQDWPYAGEIVRIQGW
jgi:putative transposase